MDALSDIVQILKELKPELTDKYHVSSIGLFGSIVRDDFTIDSDVDIIVDFSQPVGVEFIDLANLIEDRIGKPVDLFSRNGVKPRYYQEIASEIIYI
ncbi:nucleotidyltransferase family protein [Dyadobacter fermentans]|uniref:DNA polymerase beta domain protein region n=1 Tax=Dyadobacter fermentans (strain ATCC 700827 / DSM 18053 / CIP 107007 / KCTC 52180 / NS114) TaxID=471854 RepID=C6W7E8_DYAFD|nr:nucleotidyltransferase family protein [Dyadobacter fermentans]ACT94426.1 DNA polymerase beta domain protein region [Dyadobacter fermentans DSM 18053]